MKNEIVNDYRIKVYDNGGKTFDRYTVVYLDREKWGYNSSWTFRSGNGKKLFPCTGMSEHPFHPQGFGQHGDCVVGQHLGKRIPFNTLPEDCQKMVHQDTKDSE